MDEQVARRMWELYEPVHDVTYFSAESRAAIDAVGMRGFWMGYFAMRSAPLGAVTPAVVTSCFYVFHPDRVARALPDAWHYATPHDALTARLTGVDAALRRLCGKHMLTSAVMAEAATLAGEAAAATDTPGRILAAANQALELPEPPHLALWQATTTLREHRGDGHLAVLVSRGIGPVHAQLFKVAAGESDAEVLRQSRKWDAQVWSTTQEQMRERGWLTRSGELTTAGTTEHAEIERLTDAAAMAPWHALGTHATQRLAELLTPLTRAVLQNGAIPAGNPIGLTSSKNRTTTL
jgi:hypothetical protein